MLSGMSLSQPSNPCTSTNAVRVSKVDFSQSAVGGFSPPIPVTSIDVDALGYISVNFGGSGLSTGFYLYDPAGVPAEDGGGNAHVFNQKEAFTPQ